MIQILDSSLVYSLLKHYVYVRLALKKGGERGLPVLEKRECFAVLHSSRSCNLGLQVLSCPSARTLI